MCVHHTKNYQDSLRGHKGENMVREAKARRLRETVEEREARLARINYVMHQLLSSYSISIGIDIGR